MFINFTTTFYDGKQAVAHEASVAEQSHGLAIKYADATEIFSYDNIKIVAKPEHGRSGEIARIDNPSVLLSIPSQEIFLQILTKLPTQSKRLLPWKLLSQITITICLISLCVFWLIPLAAPKLIKFIPHKWERALGRHVVDSIVPSKTECADKKGLAALHKIQQTLASVSGNYPFEILVTPNPTSNAFTAPGGYIVIFSQLLNNAESAEEFAGVLAHEMGHAVKRHGLEKMVRHLSIAFVIDIVTGGGGGVLYLATQMNELEYNQKNEAEADDFVLNIFSKTNTNPDGFATFFKRNQAKKSTKKFSFLRYLSTHPSHEEREQKIKKHYLINHKYTPILTKDEWGDLKNICENIR